jgi:hypothetical protein
MHNIFTGAFDQVNNPRRAKRTLVAMLRSNALRGDGVGGYVTIARIAMTGWCSRQKTSVDDEDNFLALSVLHKWVHATR